MYGLIYRPRLSTSSASADKHNSLGASLMAIPPTDFTFLAEANSKQWLDAVLMQGERCVVALNALRIRCDSEELRRASNTMRVEEHFFVIALGKAMDWLSEFAQLQTAYRPAIERYLSQLPHARDVRNMREHDIEYFKGEGRRQPNFVHKHTDENGQVLAQSDGSSTVVFGDKYLIGGRLDLNGVLRISKDLSLSLRIKRKKGPGSD